MSAMLSSAGTRHLGHQATPRGMSVRTGMIIGATCVLFAVLHVTGMALMMSTADRSTAESAMVLRGD
jgi:hypothetical protein